MKTQEEIERVASQLQQLSGLEVNVVSQEEGRLVDFQIINPSGEFLTSTTWDAMWDVVQSASWALPDSFRPVWTIVECLAPSTYRHNY